MGSPANGAIAGRRGQLSMETIFLGVDVAGASNTWVCGLSPRADGLTLSLLPGTQSLDSVVRYTEQHHVVAVAIDAQLTSAISEEKGFRTSDIQLRRLLPVEFRNWVASQNSLMAVPLRGRQLAEALAPIVGTIIETHPRACLLFGSPDLIDAIRNYKDADSDSHCRALWGRLVERFKISSDVSEMSDGAIDSVVCALVAYLFHHQPDQLLKLQHGTPGKTGRGPFYVFRPEAYRLVGEVDILPKEVSEL